MLPGGFVEGGGCRSILVAPWSLHVAPKSMLAMALKQSELLLLAQGAGSCRTVRGDFQLIWRLRCTGTMLFGRC